MNVREFLLPVMSVVMTFASYSMVYADNKLIYPPDNSSNIFQYPPALPNSNREFPNVAPYVFGQNNPSNRLQFIPAPIPAQARAYNQRPFVGVPQSSFTKFPPFAPNNIGGKKSNNSVNNFPFSNTNMMPFGNTNNGFNPFSKGNMPFSNNTGGLMPSNPMNTMFGNNNQNFNVPFFNSNNNRKKAWGTKRNIWPDFYTDFTDEAWDTMTSAPRDLGRMPGGWRFPYISTPDPVTVSDAIVNQFPPIAEEVGNMADFSDWGIFDNK